jgi:hypothetical protein
MKEQILALLLVLARFVGTSSTTAGMLRRADLSCPKPHGGASE